MNKKPLVLLVFIINTFLLLAQTDTGISVKIENPKTGDNSFINRFYPGGEEALYQYLVENIQYPPLLADIDMEGDVNMRFDIGVNGKAENVEILRGFDPLADDQALDAITGMPQWKPVPADENHTEINLTIYFTLTDELKKRIKEQEKETTTDKTVDQAKNEINEADSEKEKKQNDSINVKLPEFPGGQNALNEFLKTNMKYPKRAIDMQIEGRVLYQLTVTETGEITNIRLFKGIYSECNEEAFYLIKKMPKWTPGTKNGELVAMQILLPIPFELPK